MKRAKKLTEEHKKHISESMKGKHNSSATEYKSGYKHTEEWKRRISEQTRGENHPNYIDGRSEKAYPLSFSQSLKDEIRERDDYECQICGVTEDEHIKEIRSVLEVHHIDFNKENNDKRNLITLCKICNIKVNKDREMWKEILCQKVEKRFSAY